MSLREKKIYNDSLLQLLIAVIAFVLFVPFAGRVHLFDWDEINFAECAREMIVSHDYLNVQIGFKPFWEKPPLFIWMQVLSMKAFGINEFAARFPDAVCGIVTLLLIFNIGKRLNGGKFGLWWVLAYAGSILPQFYFRSGIIDPWFNVLIFISVWFFFKLNSGANNLTAMRRFTYAALWGSFTGLAILTKGPTALLVIGLVTGIAYLPSVAKLVFRKQNFLKQNRYRFSWTDICIFLAFTVLVGGSWFVAQILTGRSEMVLKFITYQVRLFTIPDAGHGGNWSYHFLVLLFGVFPASFFAIFRFRTHTGQTQEQNMFQVLMLILFWTVLLLFTIVKTKIVHYSSLCYLPLTYFAALAMHDIAEYRLKWRPCLSIVLVIFGLIIALITGILPFMERFKKSIINSGLIHDDFALANLQATVQWSPWISVIGFILLGGIIAAIRFNKKNPKRALALLFISSALFINAAILTLPYRIEQYTQRAAIAFFQSKQNEKCYILNAGYFSYAPLFYANRIPEDIKRPMWLLTGKIDKPFYLVLKEPEYRQWKHILPAMQLLYIKNGFVFLVRQPQPKY